MISSLPSPQPVFYRDSKGKATNNSSRVLRSPALVDEAPRLLVEAILIVPVDVIMIKVRVVPVL